MERYKTEWIPVKVLSVVWVNAQRPYDEKWAKQIADNFDPDKFDPIVVTQPNGQGIYHIVEGQHRRHALEMFAAKTNNGIGENELAPCRVIDEVDPARAAEIWLGINSGRKATKPVTNFLVAVTAKRDDEVAIKKIVTKVGYKISTTRAPGSISAVSALKMIYSVHSPRTLEYTLQALRNLWGEDPTAVSSALLRGFAIFLHEFSGDIDIKRLHQQVGKRFTPFKLRDAALARRTSTLESIAEAISELLIREYNKGLKDPSKKLHHKKT